MRCVKGQTDIVLPRSLGEAPHKRASRCLGMVSVLVLVLASSGCSSSLSKFKGSLNDVPGPSTREAGAPNALEALARRYDAKPGEKQASLAYANALRGRSQHAQAVAVLQRTSIQNVGDRDVAAAYGKALADVGKFQEAMQVLTQAHNADRPDWRVLSSQGAISDQMGEHQRAREFYTQAMQMAPNEPSVLTNYGLSFVLTKDLAKAEEILRRAASMPNADMRTQANLDLVLSLRGKATNSIQAQTQTLTPRASTSAPKQRASIAVPTAKAAPSAQ